MQLVRTQDPGDVGPAMSQVRPPDLLAVPTRLRLRTLARPPRGTTSGPHRSHEGRSVNHLTPFEKRVYRSGHWLWDADRGPRCRRCGCLEDNHAWTKAKGWGRCEVCGCPTYEEPRE
jgi:hypothetical protein